MTHLFFLHLDCLSPNRYFSSRINITSFFESSDFVFQDLLIRSSDFVYSLGRPRPIDG